MPGHSKVLWLRLWWNLLSSAGLFDARSEISVAVFEIGNLVLEDSSSYSIHQILAFKLN